jgi:hypothetical protein
MKGASQLSGNQGKGRFRADRYRSHVALWVQQAGQALKPEREVTEAFLRGLDCEARQFSFRTFSDTAYTQWAGGDPLEREIHGSLDDCWQELMWLNRSGAAVAVTVNQTNGQGRAAKDIVRVRALFLDDDGMGDERNFTLTPHLRVITSTGHNHYYWRVSGIELAQFPSLQRRLAQCYGGDSRVFALNQAMQLPGFWRRKQMTKPRLPSLVINDPGAPYQASQLQQLLGIDYSADVADALNPTAV